MRTADGVPYPVLIDSHQGDKPAVDGCEHRYRGDRAIIMTDGNTDQITLVRYPPPREFFVSQPGFRVRGSVLLADRTPSDANVT